MNRSDVKTLNDLIAAVESDGDQYAIRYEPNHQPRFSFIESMRDKFQISTATAEMMCKCSWGMYQIMGDELMALNLSIHPVQFCCSIGTQNVLLQEYLDAHHINLTLDELRGDKQKLEMFARIYNGPDNVDAYVARMESFLK